MADDRYSKFSGGLTASAIGGEAVTPDDDNDLSEVSRMMYVGGAGNLAVTMKDGSSLTFTSLSAGAQLPIRVSRVLATGTTATAILALY